MTTITNTDTYTTLHTYLQNNTPLTQEDHANIFTLLTKKYSTRDAIVTTVLNIETITTETMQKLAENPTCDNIMNTVIEDCFNHATGYNQDVTQRFQHLLNTLIAENEDNATNRDMAQLYAIKGYMYWWEGNEQDIAHAVYKALALDMTCGLANITKLAIEKDVWPATARHN